MRIRLVKFALSSLLAIVATAPLCLGQFDEPDANGGAAAAQQDDIFGFGDDSQQISEEEQAFKAAETDRLNQEAAAKADAGDLNGALSIYEEAIRENPNFTSLLERARILVEQGEIKDAINSYLHAVQAPDTFEDRAVALPALLELGQAYLDTEQYNQAISAFSTALRLPNQSRNAEILFNIGLAQTEFALNQQYATAQTKQEQLLQGLDSFDKALRIDPDYAAALYERGNTNLLLGDADKALDDFERAVQIDPTNTDARAQVGFVSSQRGLSEAVQRKGQSAKILFDLNRSIEQLTQWLNIVPEDQEVDEEDTDAILRENVLLYRSATYIALGDEQPTAGTSYYQQAVEDANAAIAIDEDNADAFYQKGLALRMMGDLPGAVEAYTETIDLAPGNAEALLRRGIVRFRQNDLELAKADLEKSIRFAPRGINPRAYFWLGLCHQREDATNRAILNYSSAIRFRPGFLNAYLNRGLGYMKLGRYSRATRDFNEVLRIDGKHAQARSLRNQSMASEATNRRRAVSR